MGLATFSLVHYTPYRTPTVLPSGALSRNSTLRRELSYEYSRIRACTHRHTTASSQVNTAKILLKITTGTAGRTRSHHGLVRAPHSPAPTRASHRRMGSPG
eukprot:2391486-Prymnesium_polylepis.1